MTAIADLAHILVIDDDQRIRDLLKRFLARNGYLVSVARDAAHAPRAPDRDSEGHVDITSAVHEGEALLLQVTRDALADKGARLTTEITLPGRVLVLTPTVAGIALSRRIDDAGGRERLTGLLEDLLAPDEGCVVRTAAAGASDETLRQEVEEMRAGWHRVDLSGGAEV